MSARVKMPEPWPPDYLLFGHRTCTKCGRDLPACTSHFVSDSTQREGLSTACRDCRNAADHRRWPDRREYMTQRRKAQRMPVAAETTG